MHEYLQLILILISAAVFVVIIFSFLKVPELIGYLIVGILIGPLAFSFVNETKYLNNLAEFGIVFLMFSIGLEFSIQKLLKMKKIVFVLGSLQIILSMIVFMAILFNFGFNWKSSLIIAGIFSMASTAILAKILSDRLELHTESGRQIIGILLFQDLAVIPLLIFISSLNNVEGDFISVIFVTISKAIVMFMIIFLFGQKLIQKWFGLIVKRKSAELFSLNILLFTLGIAWVFNLVGLSYVLGAFFAGMLISETKYRFLVEKDIRPFKDLLLGLFFVTMGMYLDPKILFDYLPVILIILICLIAIKSVIIFLITIFFKSDLVTSLRTSLALSGAGEFGLVILSQANYVNIIDPIHSQIILCTVILSMLLSPFIIKLSEKFINSFSLNWSNESVSFQNIASNSINYRDHIIICGYGMSGQNVARFLEKEKINYIAFDVDSEIVKQAKLAGDNVMKGDISDSNVLLTAGILRAKAVVISFSNYESITKILKIVKKINPKISTIIRTVKEENVEKFKKLGASEVIVEKIEGSLMMAAHALILTGVPSNSVLKRIRITRSNQYKLFKGFYHGLSDKLELNESESELCVFSFEVRKEFTIVGKTLEELNLKDLGVEVKEIKRDSKRMFLPKSESLVKNGDILILVGTEDNLKIAKENLI